jgi:hypothetical protein
MLQELKFGKDKKYKTEEMGGSGFDPIGRGARPSSTDTRGDQNNSKESFPVLTGPNKLMKLFILIRPDQSHCCKEGESFGERPSVDAQIIQENP